MLGAPKRQGCWSRLSRTARIQALARASAMMSAWLSAALAQAPPDPRRMARLAEAWERTQWSRGRCRERKPFVFNAFAWLAEAARG